MRAAVMRKVILELTTDTDDSLSVILRDLEREINCASNSYDVVGISEDGQRCEGYVSRRYLREKWDNLKWDMEKVIGVYDDGDDNVAENAQRVANEVIYFIEAIAKEIG
jgi:hypothetical protein